MVFIVRFSAHALSTVFTSDKLLLTVLINVLHPNIEKVVNRDSSSAETVKPTEHCSDANRQYVGEAVGKLLRQKSATMPAKQKRDICDSRRLSEPLIKTVEQRQTSATVACADIAHVDRTCDHPSAVIENSRLDGAVSKLFGSRNSPVWLSSTVSSRGHLMTSACSEEPLVVNPVYGSDDCSTLKSLSFEKKDLSLPKHTSALNQVLYVPENRENGSVSDQHMSSSSAQEDKCSTVVAVTPAFSDFAVEDNFTSLEVPSSLPTSHHGNAGISSQVYAADNEADSVCTQFQYRKICVYLQEGTWRHSPHSLHCIRIDDDISLVFLCEVMSLLF